MEKPKEFTFEGWSINLQGKHMDNKTAFVKEISRFWPNNGEKIAAEAWEAAQKLLNPKKEKPSKHNGTVKLDK